MFEAMYTVMGFLSLIWACVFLCTIGRREFRKVRHVGNVIAILFSVFTSIFIPQGFMLISGLLTWFSFLDWQACYSWSYKLMLSKQKWIRKSVSKVLDLQDYLDEDNYEDDVYDESVKILDGFDKLLHLCENYKVPFYLVNTLFEINLPSYFKLVKEYKRFLKKRKNVNVPRRQNDEIFAQCTKDFGKLIYKKITEVENMIEQGTFDIEEDFCFKSKAEEFKVLLTVDNPSDEPIVMTDCNLITEKLNQMEEDMKGKNQVEEEDAQKMTETA